MQAGGQQSCSDKWNKLSRFTCFIDFSTNHNVVAAHITSLIINKYIKT